MTAPEESGTGPVIRDHRRIDPVTGQPRRGKHAASQPAGASGAGRPGGSGQARHGKATDVDESAAAAEPEPTKAEAAEAAEAAEQQFLSKLSAAEVASLRAALQVIAF